MMNDGYDMVIASRYLGDATSDDDDMLTGIGNWLFTTLINTLHGGHYTDAMGIYRAYRTDRFSRLGLDKEDGYAPEKLARNAYRDRASAVRSGAPSANCGFQRSRARNLRASAGSVSCRCSAGGRLYAPGLPRVVPLAMRRRPAVALLAAIVGAELLHTIIAAAQHRVPFSHDGFQYFTLHYYFLNDAIQSAEIAQWIPFMNQGTVASLWRGIQSALLQNVLLEVPVLARQFNLLTLYHAGMFVDAMVLLTGTWLLARRFFGPTTAVFISLSVVGSTRCEDRPAILELQTGLRRALAHRAGTPLSGNRPVALGIPPRQLAGDADARGPTVPDFQ